MGFVLECKCFYFNQIFKSCLRVKYSDFRLQTLDFKSFRYDRKVRNEFREAAVWLFQLFCYCV